MPTLAEDKPIYLQLKEYLEGEILNGHLRADDQIPSTNELAAFFAVNPITVLKSVGMLVDEGIVYKKRGIGMFVCAGAQERLQKNYQAFFSDDSIVPMVRRAKSLGLTREELQKAIDEIWKDEAKWQI